MLDLLANVVSTAGMAWQKATDIFLPDKSESGGIQDPGAEESLIADWKIIGEKLYPDAYTYSGSAKRVEIKFKGLRTISLKPDWLLNIMVWNECRKADITPLKAVIKERIIQVPYLPDLVSEYHLVLHYHESPAIVAIGAVIAAVLISVGFVILAVKAPTGEDWRAVVTEAKGTAKWIGLGLMSITGIFVIAKLRSH